jgi:putative addiction module component (TIGR02574 family)
MTTTLEQLKTTLSALPASDRAELADYLLQSLEGDESGIRAEWLALAESRIADYESGRVVGIPAEQVLGKLLEPKQ